MNFEAKLFLKPTEEIMRNHGIDDGGKVQKYIDSEVIRLCGPYTPHRTGALKKSATTGTKIGSGKVEYASPYARFQYYGKVMVSPVTGSPWARKDEKKVLTNRELTYHGGGKCGKLWFERMKADHKDKILAGARRFL